MGMAWPLSIATIVNGSPPLARRTILASGACGCSGAQRSMRAVSTTVSSTINPSHDARIGAAAMRNATARLIEHNSDATYPCPDI